MGRRPRRPGSSPGTSSSRLTGKRFRTGDEAWLNVSSQEQGDPDREHWEGNRGGNTQGARAGDEGGRPDQDGALGDSSAASRGDGATPAFPAGARGSPPADPRGHEGGHGGRAAGHRFVPGLPPGEYLILGLSP